MVGAAALVLAFAVTFTPSVPCRVLPPRDDAAIQRA